MILFMTPVTEGYSVIQIQSKRYEILKREKRGEPPGAGRLRTGHSIYYPVLLHP